MVWFAVRSNQNWRKQYARFEADITKYSLNVNECVDAVDEIFISVIVNSSQYTEMVIELAKKHFGNSYGGVLN